jgi:hypothetical protein
VIAIIIAVAVSGAGGILAWLFKDTIGAVLFPPKNPAQDAVNQQRKMDQDAVNPVSQAQAVKDLEDGKG